MRSKKNLMRNKFQTDAQQKKFAKQQIRK